MIDISNELLSEIFGDRLKKHDNKFANFKGAVFNGRDLHINYERTDGIIQLIIVNAYEFANIGKGWALMRGYSLSSGKPIVQDDEGRQVINYWWKCYIHILDRESYDAPEQVLTLETNSATEPEAILKACEWVRVSVC